MNFMSFSLQSGLSPLKTNEIVFNQELGGTKRSDCKKMTKLFFLTALKRGIFNG